MSIWIKFKENFNQIIQDNIYYKQIFNFLCYYNHNSLLYGAYGFPTDIFIDEVIKSKFNIKIINRKECYWGKDIIYKYNNNFLEIDLMNPYLSKNFSCLTDFLLSIIKNKNANNNKHFIIIKHIDKLSKNDFSSFRIILEKYSNNVYFLCTTHKLDKIEAPIKSRFALLRMPLFTHEEIVNIFTNILGIKINKFLLEEKTRDIIKTIFISEVENNNTEIVTKEFCTLYYPPINEFYNNKKKTINDIRQFSYKCFQYNISISQILQDFIKYIPNKKKIEAIKKATRIDYMLNMTNKGKEPLYIESFICQILL